MAQYTIPAEEIHADRNFPLGKSTRRIKDANIFRGSWNESLVAVRVLPKETVVETLLERYAAWQNLRHPHVLQIFGVSLIEAGPPVVVSQYFANGGADEYTTNNPGANRAKIHGLVHGSLKPSNILVAENGQVCISDYGMVEITPSGNASSHRYYSPEAWKGVSARSSQVVFISSDVTSADNQQSFRCICICNERIRDLIYRLVTREGDRPDRLESASIDKGGISDNQWQIVEAAWQQDAALRPTFSQITKLWQLGSGDPATQDASFLRPNSPASTVSVVSMSQGPTRASRMHSIDETEPGFTAQGPYSPSLVGRGSAYEGGPHWINHRMSASDGTRVMSDTQSVASDSQRGAPQSIIGRNPVLLAKALLAEVKEGRKQEVIDDYLDKVQFLCLQSPKEAQKLVTAGIVPTVLLLLQARSIEGVGLELVLVTLGILACDPITANTVHRTNTATVLVEIISSSDSNAIIALATWCVNRICRSAEVAANLIKLDLANVLITKGLRGGPGASRMSSWCLGTLAYTDALAQTLASYDLVTASVRNLKTTSMNANATAHDICAALYPIARLARSIPLSKQLIRAGCVPLVIHHLSNSEDPQILQWSARTVGCLMRPNGGDIAKTLMDAGAATALARMPRVLPSDVVEPLAAFAFSIQRFSCAEWGSGTRKALVEAGVVDSLLAALRTAAETVEHPQVHIELALAVSFLGDVGGTSIRKEIVKAGGIDILKRVGAAGRADVAKTCQMAATSITGNLWTRNAGKIV
ncbi:hypothetical protein HWV62_44605 [Athelia sp. TMB]|nr:hypothetical protein HWV62_44605 [Athelia sp. TMB]